MSNNTVEPDLLKKFSDMDKAIKAMPLCDKIFKELLFNNSLAGTIVREKIAEGKSSVNVVSMVKDMVKDGWDVFSFELTKEIENF